MSITLDELISQLEEIREDYGGDCPVKLAMQPSWPFEYSIGEVVAISTEGKYDEDEEFVADMDELPTVYIAEGRQLAYLPGVASQELGWR